MYLYTTISTIIESIEKLNPSTENPPIIDILNRNIINKIKPIWNHLKGLPSEFTLQSRIFHSICLIIMLIMIYNIPFSLVFGMSDAVIPTLILILIQYTIYYISRFKQRTTLSYSFFSICCSLFFVYTFFNNNGIDGSALFSLSIAFFMTLMIAPRSHYWVWSAYYLIIVAGLLLSEYYYPHLIQDNYTNQANRFIDIGSTFLMSVILSQCCLIFVMNNYNQEKHISDEKTRVLKQLNEQKNKLISVISHDFNTPLNNIKSYLQIMRQMELSTKERLHIEQELMQVTTDTQNLLLNLLNWTKNNMNSMNYSIEIVNINDAISDTIQLYTKIAAEKKIELDYNISNEINVEGNYEMVDIVMRNLISNAIKFTPEAGKISIFTIDDGDHCKIVVKDNGIGLPENIKETIFSTKTIPSYGTRNEKGAGLGLSLCKEFVEKMNGEIGFQSTHGEGTEFFIKLTSAKIDESVLYD